MNLYFRLINRYHLYKLNKNIDVIDNPHFVNQFSTTMNRLYKKKGTVDRNLGASILRQYRRKYPYIPSDYSEAKKMYDDYFKMEGAINIKEINYRFKKGEKIYLCQFRRAAPIKGKRYAEYHINLSGNDELMIFEMENELDPDFYTNTRLATDREILRFKDHSEIVSNLEESIRQKYEEIAILNKFIQREKKEFVNNL
jgi:hypothetical protein